MELIKTYSCFYNYQKTVYNAINIPEIMMEPMANPVVIRNMDLSISITCTSFSFLG